MHLFFSPNAWLGMFMQKSSDEDKNPCCKITAFLIPDTVLFELHRNMVKLYPSSVRT